MEVCGVMVNRIKLADALMQSAPNKVALKLLSVLFTDKELVNGNLSGVTTSKSEERLTSIKKLDAKRVAYIKGNVVLIAYYTVMPFNSMTLELIYCRES